MVHLAPEILAGSPNLPIRQWWELFMEPDVGDPVGEVVEDSLLRRWFRMMYLRRMLRTAQM